jgi:hypothetical protein
MSEAEGHLSSGCLPIERRATIETALWITSLQKANNPGHHREAFSTSYDACYEK